MGAWWRSLCAGGMYDQFDCVLQPPPLFTHSLPFCPPTSRAFNPWRPRLGWRRDVFSPPSPLIYYSLSMIVLECLISYVAPWGCDNRQHLYIFFLAMSGTRSLMLHI